ncbi:MAG: hypothetical protein FWE53_04160 [Firmicutes bacterium]|nr:hypothetical protein [Bacillota bacterium]
MREDFINLKKQMFLGCIPVVGSFIVGIIMFINIARMSKLGDKILLVFVGMPLVGAGFCGLGFLFFTLVSEENFLLNYSLGLIIFYYLAFAFIGCQFLIFKLITKRKEPIKKIKDEDESKFI